jgi:hypothetical protein
MTVNEFYFMLRFDCFSRADSVSVNWPPLGPFYAGKVEAYNTVSFLSPATRSHLLQGFPKSLLRLLVGFLRWRIRPLQSKAEEHDLSSLSVRSP